MKIEADRQDRMKIPALLMFLAVYVLLICLSILANPITSLAESRDKPTPTPAQISPNGVDIVGGEMASAGEYPWQVALVKATYSNPNLGQFCGGSLIAPQWVLTAGHCVEDDGSVVSTSSIDVVLGINNLSDGPTYGSSGQRIGVARIFLYPGFHYGINDELNQDVALLQLESPATLNASVNTITLASSSDTSKVSAGVFSMVTGWGTTAENGGTYPDALMEVQVPIVSLETCSAGYGGLFNLNNNYHLCAGYIGGGKDSCYGDSGGPLIVPNGSGWLQAGIVSFGEGCARANYYGVYARVSYFKPWIDFIIAASSGELGNSIYLPMIVNTISGSSQTCNPDPPGESNNIRDALIVCSGNTITGTTSYPNDRDDVYKIYVQNGKKITINMTGNGGDSDLYLFPPTATDVETSSWYARSTNIANSESIGVTVNATGYWYVDIYRYEQSTANATNYQVSLTVSN